MQTRSESVDDALEFLVGDDEGMGALEWFTGNQRTNASENGFGEGDSSVADEAEFLPALAALIPAIVSAAPAIISAVSSLVNRSQPSRPAPTSMPTPPPRPTQASAPPPPPPRHAPTPASTTGPPASVPAAAPAGLPPATIAALTQLATLLPELVALVSRAGTEIALRSSESYGELQEPDVETLSEAYGRSTTIESVEYGHPAPTDLVPPADPVPLTDRGGSTDQVPLPASSALNVGVSPCPTALLVARFGPPRDVLSEECQALTSLFWEDRMVTESIGPFRVRGHIRAVGVFREALAEVSTVDSDLYTRLTSLGMLCVRHVRGLPNVVSSHAVGMALDVAVDGESDMSGQGQVPRGLSTLQRVFARHGIYWGSVDETDRVGHFEIGADLVHRWIEDGSL